MCYDLKLAFEEEGEAMSAGDLIKRGNQLNRRGELNEAITLYREAIKANPNFAWSYYLLGEVLAKRGYLEEAKKSFQEAIKLNPGNTIYRQRMSEVFNTVSQSLPWITVFGSCRVHNPMKTLALQNRYINFNNNLLAFCHNTHEIVQQINFIKNSTIIPQELIPFIVSPPDFYKYLNFPVFIDNELKKPVFFLWKLHLGNTHCISSII